MTWLRLLALTGACLLFAAPSYAYRHNDDQSRHRGNRTTNYGVMGNDGFRSIHRSPIEAYYNYYRPVISVEWKHLPDGSVVPYYHSIIPVYLESLEYQP